MRVLIIPMGSYGDVYPMIGIGVALKSRGHDVTVLSMPSYKSFVEEEAKLTFVPFGNQETFDKLLADPDLWHPLRAFKVVFKSDIMNVITEELYNEVCKVAGKGIDLVVGLRTGFGALVAHEKLQFPFVTLHFAPAQMEIKRSEYSWMPTLLRRTLNLFIDYFLIGHYAGKPVNQLRTKVGLPPITYDFFARLNASPQRAIGLFPDWYCPLEPQWTDKLVLTGFPISPSLESKQELTPEIQAFLSEGDAPIVFTPGTAMTHGHDFFRVAIATCQQIGRRGIMLTKYRDTLPEELPSGIRWFQYVPFAKLLPRCALLVHHGGIGSIAQAFSAGIPQIIMPFAFDQPDNAAQVKALGAGDFILPRNFEEAVLSKKLDQLLGSAKVQEKCRELAKRTHADTQTCLQRVCEILEEEGKKTKQD